MITKFGSVGHLDHFVDPNSDGLFSPFQNGKPSWVLTLQRQSLSQISSIFRSPRLLQIAIPLVKTHGFTREALARSVFALPASEAHPEPLSQTAVDTLFGNGDLARRNLIRAWLDDGIRDIRATPKGSTLKQVLRARLERNEPVLQFLPEVGPSLKY